jgi:hypothetical protein
MAMSARFRSTYSFGAIMRTCLFLVLVAGFTSLVIHDSFWDVLATVTFVVVLLEILKIPGVYKRLAKIRTGLGMKSTSLVNQSSPESMEK